MSCSVEITARHLTQAVVYQLVGELDLAAVPAVREQLLSAVGDVRPPTTVVLDLDGLVVLSAAASRVLSDVADLCRSRGVWVCAVIGPDRPAGQLAELVPAMPVFETVVSALERIAGLDDGAPDEFPPARSRTPMSRSGPNSSSG